MISIHCLKIRKYHYATNQLGQFWCRNQVISLFLALHNCVPLLMNPCDILYMAKTRCYSCLLYVLQRICIWKTMKHPETITNPFLVIILECFYSMSNFLGKRLSMIQQLVQVTDIAFGSQSDVVCTVSDTGEVETDLFKTGPGKTFNQKRTLNKILNSFKIFVCFGLF